MTLDNISIAFGSTLMKSATAEGSATVADVSNSSFVCIQHIVNKIFQLISDQLAFYHCSCTELGLTPLGLHVR